MTLENEKAPGTTGAVKPMNDSPTLRARYVVVNVLLWLLTAGSSRLAQLLGRPRWAVRLTFALEAARLRFARGGKL